MAFSQSKNLTSAILEEIGLEGLEGITISGLWIRLSDLLQLPLPLLDRFQIQVWNVIMQAHDYLLFYELPEPREQLKLWNRFANTDPDYGLPTTLTECPFNLYKCVPVSDGEILGSCENYDSRIPILFDELKCMSLKEINDKWGEKFVIVGNQKLRYSCLIPPQISIPTEITASQYCVLEFIGRSRKNGITTAGKFSILHCCRDAAIGFYIKNKLIRLGLITRQCYTEKRADRLIGSSLLHLTRFYSPNKTAFQAVVEKMFFALKHTPNQRLSMTGIRQLFPSENQAMIKKIQTTQFFKKIFDVSNCPAKELADFKLTSKYNGSREILCVKLKNPCLSEDELFNDDEIIEEKESNGFYDYKHSYVDMPLAEEIYRAIEKCGSEGCSQSQLCTNMSANHLNVRQGLKKAVQQKLITSYSKDMGRQRTNMLVAISCANSVKKVKEDRAKITQNLKCRDEPQLPPEPDLPPKDIKQITSTIKEVVNKFNPIPRDVTIKQIERQQMVVKLVDKLCIIQVPILRTEIIKYEQEAGYKDEICNKSIYRIIARLQKQNIVNTYEITLRLDEHARLYRYVTHPKIDINHEVMQREVLKLKNALFLFLEEKKCRIIPPRFSQTGKPKEQRIGLIPVGPQKSPKFLTARFMHEFMFYMLNDLQPNRQPLTLTETMLTTWLQSEPNINCNELYKNMVEEGISPYRDTINWKTFIIPLPIYKDKPDGWISFPDVVERMPFSLLHKIIHVPPTVDKLAIEYLMHPVKQHYMIKQLPLTIQSLVNRGRLSRILCNIVQILQLMGLIQVSEKKAKDPIQIWVYINRKASIVDTTPSEPGYIEINRDREYSRIDFNLQKMSDIKQYWNCLHKTCLVTRLGFVHKNMESDAKGVYKKRRLALTDIISPVTSFEEAPNLDIGIPPGDGLGAGGLASGLYSSFQRNWTWLVNNKHTAAAAAKLRKQSTKFMRTRMSKLSDEIMVRKTSAVTSSAVSLKKGTTRLATTSTGKVVKRKKIVSLKKKAKFPSDSIDRDAIRQMRSLRARWSHKEDLILKMARATFLFLGVPVIHLNLRDVAKITRDIIRLQCNIHNKTTQACHRRIHFMVKTNRHLPELPQWLHAMQTNDHLTSRYNSETFHRDLKEIYPVKSDFQNALAVHFLYAFGVLQAQQMENDPKYLRKKTANFPNTLKEFYKKYRECTPLGDDKSLLYTNPTITLDLQLATINNVLHSSLGCVRDKTQYNLQIFDVFKTYSEEVLHTAFKIARIDGLVVSRKKSQTQTYTTQLTGPSFVFSNKYRMSLMFLRYPYVVLDMLYAFFTQTTMQIYNNEPTVVEIKSPHSGQLFVLAELLWHQAITIEVRPPSNILTIDPMAQQSNTSQTQKIMDHYHNLLEYGPQTEYSKHFDALGELATRVKFKAGNVKHKINYNPFDVIAKMDSVQIHFFCFLRNMNQSVDLNFSKLLSEKVQSNVNENEEEENDDDINLCPFSNDCVMKTDDYLNSIETIVKNQENCLVEINEEIDLNSIETKTNSIIIYSENILSIFESYRICMKSHLAKEDSKDLGSTTLTRKPLNLVQISKSILEEYDETQMDDEHEPELNKDEKNARAQDVFVVNLPCLKISASKESEEWEKVEHKGIMMPEVLMETAILRDAVLERIVDDACWKYTQNDLGTLKTLMTEIGLTDEEQDQIVKIHDFIESHDLGAPAADLVKRFPDVEFLQKATKLLRQHYLVLRAGVSTFVYVQKNHVRHWVIHTRHIKRLERESMGKLVPGQKRKPDDEYLSDNEPSGSKQSRTNDGRRKPKPVERYEDMKEVRTSSLDQTNSKEQLLVLRPCPWIRVNGSLNRRLLDKWLGSILIECSVQNGCTVQSVCLRYKQMHAADIMYLLEVLTELKIVELRSYKPRSVGLFTKYEELEQSKGNEFTDPQNTYIITMPDATLRMTQFIGDKLYRSEFV
ncbi:general transcription factor 3C polypeptide 1 [Episyrphus balteatus]|uniref:general transcription factor 3C polypeptide 1 n=1 Tax=Episyrphus balteatus TaxID=286459 RepID=UPI0024855145|nr:general transcription factor 3C polypeptide 1 [Episyrphus balteatus]